MAGRIVDLPAANVTLPKQLAIDTNVLTTRLLRPRIVSSDHLIRLRRVRRFFGELRDQDSLGFIPPTVFQELIHAAIRKKDVGELATQGHANGGKKSLDAIVTEYPDLRRAATDFDVYTWL